MHRHNAQVCGDAKIYGNARLNLQETPMNIQNLINAAGGGDEFSHLETGNTSLNEALALAIEEDRVERQKALGKELKELITLKAQVLLDAVRTIRSAKRVIASEKARLAAFDRAWAYGAETGNFVPLAKQLGALEFRRIPTEVVQDVPVDWSPKKVE